MIFRHTGYTMYVLYSGQFCAWFCTLSIWLLFWIWTIFRHTSILREIWLLIYFWHMSSLRFKRQILLKYGQSWNWLNTSLLISSTLQKSENQRKYRKKCSTFFYKKKKEFCPRLFKKKILREPATKTKKYWAVFEIFLIRMFIQKSAEFGIRKILMIFLKLVVRFSDIWFF